MFPALPTQRACQLLGTSRGAHYRKKPDKKEKDEEELRLRERVETVVLTFCGYGYRRVTAQLKPEAWRINHKRVRRRMRAWGLSCRRRRRFTRTTNSDHGHSVAPNLLKEGRAQGLDEVWVSDITYIALPSSFCYLASILDACSRRVVGWHLGRQLDASLTMKALEKALATRRPKEGGIHHSDRGVQYACKEYAARLQGAGARISMAAKGAPRENAQAESFYRTLKWEEVYPQGYQSYQEAEAGLERFINEIYNTKRLHSSLGYRPPSEYEQLITAGALT